MTVKLPPKRPGDHRWIALATFAITPGQARAASTGAAVKLGPHNLICQSIGCVDCESPWPGGARCSAGASPDMADITAGTAAADAVPDAEGQMRMFAAVDVIGRSGCKQFEVGYLDPDAPSHLARWHAHAQYRGARISTDEHPGPVEAAEALAWRVLEGGQCTHCTRTIGIKGHAGGGPCRWRRLGDCWVPGCIEDEGDIERYIAQRRKDQT